MNRQIILFILLFLLPVGGAWPQSFFELEDWTSRQDAFYEANFYSLQSKTERSAHTLGENSLGEKSAEPITGGSVANLGNPTLQDSSFRDRRNFLSHRLGIQYWKVNDFAELDLDLSLVANYPEEDFRFFLGKNAYVGFFLPMGSIWVGRKELVEGTRKQTFTENKDDFRGLDGGEGLGLEILHWEDWTVQVFLWDYYRGFPVWEYQQTPIYNSIEKEKWKEGQRYRQGIRFVHEKGDTTWEGDFFYLNLGNWGITGRDDLELSEKEGGDGDHLYRFRMGGNYQFEFLGKEFLLGMEYHLSRGLDKTFADPKRPERSMPIRGEAVVFRFLIGEIDRNGWNLEAFAFLPNTPRTGDSLEPLTMGYVGMGNPLHSGAFLTRELNFYPSAWVTEYGLEWNRWEEGKWNGGIRGAAGLGRLELGYRLKDYRLAFRGEYMLPRRIIPHDKGAVSIRKMDYENRFFAESGVRLEYSNHTGNDSSVLGVEASFLWSQENNDLSGTFLRVYGRYIF